MKEEMTAKTVVKPFLLEWNEDSRNLQFVTDQRIQKYRRQKDGCGVRTSFNLIRI